MVFTNQSHSPNPTYMRRKSLRQMYIGLTKYIWLELLHRSIKYISSFSSYFVGPSSHVTTWIYISNCIFICCCWTKQSPSCVFLCTLFTIFSFAKLSPHPHPHLMHCHFLVSLHLDLHIKEFLEISQLLHVIVVYRSTLSKLAHHVMIFDKNSRWRLNFTKSSQNDCFKIKKTFFTTCWPLGSFFVAHLLNNHAMCICSMRYHEWRQQ